MVTEENFMYSNAYFFVKSCFRLTKESLEVTSPKMFLFIPTGKEEDTYAFNNISEVSLDTKSYTTSLILGSLLSYFAFDTFPISVLWGCLFLFIGLSTVFNAYKTFIVIEDVSGKKSYYSISYFERAKAEAFVGKVNNTF